MAARGASPPSSPTEAAFLRAQLESLQGQERLKAALRRTLSSQGGALPASPAAAAAPGAQAAADSAAAAYARVLQQRQKGAESPPLFLVASRAAMGSAGLAALAALLPKLPPRVQTSLAVVEMRDDTLTCVRVRCRGCTRAHARARANTASLPPPRSPLQRRGRRVRAAARGVRRALAAAAPRRALAAQYAAGRARR